MIDVSRQFGQCDLCKKTITGNNKETILMLRANYIKMDVKTYTLEYVLCEECKKKFEQWINYNMRKGDDTT